MAGPWEKYAAPSDSGDQAPSGPWMKYQAEPDAPSDGPAPAPIDRNQAARAQFQAWADNHKDDSIWQKLAGSLSDAPSTAGANPFLAGLGPATSVGARLATGPVGRTVAGGIAGGAHGFLRQPQGDETRIGNAAGEAATAAAIGAGAEGINSTAEALWPKAKAIGAKIGNLWTGVPKTEIQTFGERAPEVEQMMTEADDSLPTAADNVRTGYQKDIQATRQRLNKQVADAIAAQPKPASASIQPIIDELQAQKAKLDPTFHSEAIAGIDDLIDKVKQGQVLAPGQAGLGVGKGKTNAYSMNLIKQLLQDRAKASYVEKGQMFQSAPQTARAAKSAAAVARGIFNDMVPDAAEANSQLEALHNIDDDLNDNLIKPGKSDSALMAAGSGANQRNAELLDDLGKITGTDMRRQAENLAAARTFNKPSWDPREMNGKSVFRAGMGALAGGVAAHESGQPWEAGAIAGATLASPAALKLAIKTGRPIVGAVKSVGPAALAATSKAAPFIAGGTMDVLRGAQPDAAPAPNQLADRSPARGHDAWAQDGLQKLGIQDPGVAARLMADPKSRDLLIQAHTLPAGHKKLQVILNQIQSKWGSP